MWAPGWLLRSCVLDQRLTARFFWNLGQCCLPSWLWKIIGYLLPVWDSKSASLVFFMENRTSLDYHIALGMQHTVTEPIPSPSAHVAAATRGCPCTSHSSNDLNDLYIPSLSYWTLNQPIEVHLLKCLVSLFPIRVASFNFSRQSHGCPQIPPNYPEVVYWRTHFGQLTGVQPVVALAFVQHEHIPAGFKIIIAIPDSRPRLRGSRPSPITFLILGLVFHLPIAVTTGANLAS